MAEDIILERQTYILVSGSGFALFPSNKLFPADNLYPIGSPSDVSNSIIDTIVAGTTKVEEMIVEKNPKFGELLASKFECTVYGVSDLSGKYITVYQTHNGSYVPVFSGIVDSCKLDRLGTDRTLIAYDPAYSLRERNVASWWSSFWTNRETATLKQIRDDLLETVLIPSGMFFEDVELPNDTTQVTKNVDLEQCSFGDMLSMLCELTCCFPHFNRWGELEFIVLNTEANAIDLRGRYEGEHSTFEEYNTVPIEGVQFFDSEGELKYSVGDETNAYQISKNIFTYDMGSSELTAIGNVIIDYLSELEYNPSNVKMIVSDLSLEPGDYVRTDRGYFYIFSIECSGSLLVEQTLKATGDEQLGKETQTLNFESVILREKIARVNYDVEQFKIEYADFKQGTQASLEVNSEAIRAEVTRATQKEGTLTTSIEANAEAIRLEASRAKGEEDTLSASLEVTNNAIRSEVSRATAREGTLQSSIEQTADAVETKVSKNGVISSINQTSESVTINANKINLNGAVSANGYFQVDTNGKVSISGSNGNLHIDDGVLSQWTTDSQGYRNYIGFDQWGAQLNGAGYFNSYSNIFGLNYDSLRFGIKTTLTDLEYGHYGWNEWFLYNRNVGAWAAYPAGIATYDSIKLWCTTGLKQTKESDYSLISQVDGNIVMYYHYGASDQRVIWASGTSSKWMKENISDMTDEEAKKLLDVHVVDFDFKKGFMNGQEGCHGVIAEEIADIIPYATQYPPNYEEPESEEDVEPGKTPLPHVNYENLVPHLIKMVQIQQKDIDELKERIDRLERG